MNKLCGNIYILLNVNNIKILHKTTYLGEIFNSDMKTSSDVIHHTRKLYTRANILLLCDFCYCTNGLNGMLFK